MDNNYLVLSRKWRPQRFDDVVGQFHVTKTLQNALKQKKVKMAAIDVLSPEPPYDESPNNSKYQHELLDQKNIFLTPHIGASTSDAQQKVSDEWIKRNKRLSQTANRVHII
mgnify:CR=1 FL=1